jgi:hypothetical protein
MNKLGDSLNLGGKALIAAATGSILAPLATKVALQRVIRERPGGVAPVPTENSTL